MFLFAKDESLNLCFNHEGTAFPYSNQRGKLLLAETSSLVYEMPSGLWFQALQQSNEKKFGAQGRVITTAFLYHRRVCDCIILSTGETDPEDQGAPIEAAVMKGELMACRCP